MQMRRFTPLTNAFSKKLANHIAAISLHFMYYNSSGFIRRFGVTPAMAAGVTDHVWDVADILKLLGETPRKRGRPEQNDGHFGPTLGLDPRDQHR
jgi:hypothetical protein